VLAVRVVHDDLRGTNFLNFHKTPLNLLCKLTVNYAMLFRIEFSLFLFFC
jgi:hypothetical protein